MFCNNCGTQFEDNQAFCPNCGTPADNGNAAQSPADIQANNDLKSKLPLLVGAGVILLLVIIILCVALSGGHKKAVKKSFKYFEKGQSEKLAKLELPKSVLEEMLDDTLDIDLDEYCEIQDAAFDALWEGLKDEGKVKVSYEIKNCENIDDLDKLEDDVVYDDLDDFKDAMDDTYDDYDFDADKIKKAYVYKIKFTIEVDGDKAVSETIYTIAYKYKGDWYLSKTLDALTIAGLLDDDDFEDVIEDVYKEYKDLY